MCVCVLEKKGNPLVVPIVRLIEQARTLATGPALAESACTLYLLRRKIHRAGVDLQDVEGVVEQLDAVVALLIPGFSLSNLWVNHRASLGDGPRRLRDAVVTLLAVLDRHCPPPPEEELPPPSTSPAGPEECYYY